MRFIAHSCLAALLLATAACGSGHDLSAADGANFSGVVASIDAADRPGTFEIEEHEYALAPTGADGVIEVPAGVDPVTTQVAGRLYLPKASGPRPLVVLLHGNHPTCGFYAVTADRTRDPRFDMDTTYTAGGQCLDGWEVAKSYQGYAYVAQHLASHGFAVASIDANRGVTGGFSPTGIDGGLIDARGRLVLRNLELFASWNESESGTAMLDGVDMRGRLDLAQVGMMGHSRGGEGVRAAYNIYQRDLFSDFFHWKTKKPQLTFRAIFEIGAVDFGHPAEDQASVAYYDAPGLAWTALIPGCDGDVSDFQSVNSYTRMLQGAGTAPRSVVVAWGANHNFFNTEWQMSDAFACRGSQEALFESPVMAPFTTTAAAPAWCTGSCWDEFQSKNTMPVGVRGSTRQADIGRILMTAFFKAHLGTDANPELAHVFDTKFDLPPRLNEIAPLWRDYVAPDSGASWAPSEILSKVGDVVGVDVKPVEKVLDDAAADAIERLRATAPADSSFTVQPLRTRDAVSLQWSSAATERHASIALPAAPAETSVEYIQLVIANMPQTHPCLAPVLGASCAGDGTPLDAGVRLVNADGTMSDVHRISEFGNLVPYLRSNVAAAYGDPSITDQPGSYFILMNEPVFDTVVIPLKDFAVGDRAFPLTASTQLRIDFDGTPEGTVSVRNVRLLGAIAPPVIATRH